MSCVLQRYCFTIKAAAVSVATVQRRLLKFYSSLVTTSKYTNILRCLHKVDDVDEYSRVY